jgi:hypothetical protein
MKKLYIGAAVAAALALTGFSAQAGCFDPRAASSASGEQRVSHMALPHSYSNEGERGGPVSIVGTWFVTYSLGGEAYIQWHSDGTEWENINHPILGGNICMGSWKQTGRFTYVRHHAGWVYNNGVLSNYFIEDETAELAAHGRSYSGTDSFTMYNLDGTVAFGPLAGTAAATRF